jgi:hypothetical protein
VGGQLPKGTIVQPVKCSRPQCGLVGIACSKCEDGVARSKDSRAKLSTKGSIDKAKCHLCKGKHNKGQDFRAERCLRGAKELAAPLLSAVASTFSSCTGLILSDPLVVEKFSALFPRLLESCPTVVTLAALLAEAIILTPGYSLRADWLSDTSRDGARGVVTRLSEVFLRHKDESQTFQPALKTVIEAMFLLATKGIHWELSHLQKEWTGVKRGIKLDMAALTKTAKERMTKKAASEEETTAGPSTAAGASSAPGAAGIVVWLTDYLELQSRLTALEKRFAPLTADTVRCAPIVVLENRHPEEEDGPRAASPATLPMLSPIPDAAGGTGMGKGRASSAFASPAIAVASANAGAGTSAGVGGGVAKDVAKAPARSPSPVFGGAGSAATSDVPSKTLTVALPAIAAGEKPKDGGEASRTTAVAGKEEATTTTTATTAEASIDIEKHEQVKAFGHSAMPAITAIEAANLAMDVGDFADVALGAVGMAAAMGVGGSTAASATAASTFMVHSYTVAQTSMSVADNITLSALLASVDGVAKVTGSALFASSLGSLGLLYVGLSPVITSLKALDWIVPKDLAGGGAMTAAYTGAAVGTAGSGLAVAGAMAAVGAQGTFIATALDGLALIGAAAGGSTAAGLAVVGAAPALAALGAAGSVYGGIKLGQVIAHRTPAVSTYRETRNEEIQIYFSAFGNRLFDGLLRAVDAERTAFTKAKAGATDEAKAELKKAAVARMALYPESEDIEDEDESDMDDEDEGDVGGGAVALAESHPTSAAATPLATAGAGATASAGSEDPKQPLIPTSVGPKRPSNAMTIVAMPPKPKKKHYALFSFAQCMSGIKLCSGCNRSSCFTETSPATRTSRPVLRCNRLDCLRYVCPCRMCESGMALGSAEWCSLCQNPTNDGFGRSAAIETRNCRGLNRTVTVTVVNLPPGKKLSAKEALALASDAHYKAGLSPAAAGHNEQLVVTQGDDEDDPSHLDNSTTCSSESGATDGSAVTAPSNAWAVFDALGKEIVSSVKRIGRPRRARKALMGKMTAADKAFLKEQAKKEKKEKEEKAKKAKEAAVTADGTAAGAPASPAATPSTVTKTSPAASATAGSPPPASSAASSRSSFANQFRSYFGSWGSAAAAAAPGPAAAPTTPATTPAPTPAAVAGSVIPPPTEPSSS